MEINKDYEEGQTLAHKVVSQISDLRREMIQKMDELKETQSKYQNILALYQKLKKPESKDDIYQSASNHLQSGPTIVFTAVTNAYVPLAKNFLCYLRALEDPPKVLIYAVDDAGELIKHFYFYFISNGYFKLGMN